MTVIRGPRPKPKPKKVLRPNPRPTKVVRGGVVHKKIVKPRPKPHSKPFEFLPEAAGFQAPFKVGWQTVKKVTKGTQGTWRKPHIKHQKTTAATLKTAGGKKTVIGQPQAKNYSDVVGGQAFERKKPNVFMTTDKDSQFVPDFVAAGKWWQSYIKIPIVGTSQKGAGMSKGISGKMKDKSGKLVTRNMGIAKSGTYTVQAGEGKRKTYIHQSSRLEAGQTKGAPSDSVKGLTKGVPATTKFKKLGTPSKKMINLNNAWASLGSTQRAKVLKARGKVTESNVMKYGFNSLTDAQKKKLLVEAGYKFD
mgnify:CR=1 FL=1